MSKKSSSGSAGKIGRDARTGQYIPVRQAREHPATSVVEPRGKPPKGKK